MRIRGVQGDLKWKQSQILGMFLVQRALESDLESSLESDEILLGFGLRELGLSWEYCHLLLFGEIRRERLEG